MNFDYTDAIANKENQIIFDHCRITLLNEYLIRVEYTKEKFLDLPTQRIWYRNFKKNFFTYQRVKDRVKIYFHDMEFSIHLKDFARSYVIKNKHRIYFNNKQNLKGTTRTLDMSPDDNIHYDDPITCAHYDLHYLDKKVLDYGVCSKNGVAIYDDCLSLVMHEDNHFSKNELEHDYYVFVSDDYYQSIEELYHLTGYPPMLPKYVFGNWWSRYWPYTDEEYLHLLDQFDAYHIPLNVISIDMDWHYVDLEKEFQLTKNHLTDEKYGELHGWTGFTWNQHLFKDYKGFLKEIKQKHHLHVALNLHPASGIRWFEKDYVSSAKNMGIDPNSKECIAFDFTNPKFIETYFNLLHQYEKDGVDFWWIDWQQGNKSKLEGFDPLWGLNHYHVCDQQKQGKRPLILSRYCGLGSHRYPLGFSGDTTQKWNILKYIIFFTATASNCGYTFWSHDIGGHHGGYKDDELYIRWLQFALFNPINRIHSALGDMYGKEMWNYHTEITYLAIDLLQRREQMIPYIYTFSCMTSLKGIPLITPMYYKYPKQAESYRFKEQYFFNDLLVAPIVKKADTSKMAHKKIYLPEGEWTDIYSDTQYKGNNVLDIYRELSEIPCFAKEGTILYKNKEITNQLDNPHHLILKFFKGNGRTYLYEDDGETLEYQKNHFIYTTIQQTIKQDIHHIVIEAKGDFSLIPEKRNFDMIFSNETILDVKMNEPYRYHCYHEGNNTILQIFDVDVKKILEIELKYEPISRLKYLQYQLWKVLIKQNMDNQYLNELYDKIKNSDLYTLKECIQNSPLKARVKARLDEILNIIERKK